MYNYDPRMKYIIHQRTIKAQYYPKIFFNLFGNGSECKKHIKILHDFTGKVFHNFIILFLLFYLTFHVKYAKKKNSIKNFFIGNQRAQKIS